MPGMFQATIEGVGEIAAYKTYVLLGSLRHDVLVTKQPRVFEAGPFHSRLRRIIRGYRRRVIAKVEKDAYLGRSHWDAGLERLWISALCRVLIGIRRYGHGGAVLISDTARGSVRSTLFIIHDLGKPLSGQEPKLFPTNIIRT